MDGSSLKSIGLEIEKLVQSAGSENLPIVELADLIIKRAVLDGTDVLQLEANKTETSICHTINNTIVNVGCIPARFHNGLLNRFKILTMLDVSKSNAYQEGLFEYTDEDISMKGMVRILPTEFGELMSITFHSSK